VTDPAAHYDRIASTFTQRVREVPPGAWDNPAPCEGWVARDIVGHLVEWVPAFFENYAGLHIDGDGPTVSDDPVAAWETFDASIRRVLADPASTSRSFDMHGTTYTIGQAVDMFCTGDVFLHTWDLARATGLDETLDPDEVHAALVGMEPMDAALRQSGQYGPRVEVSDDADEQTRLIAFVGRQP
jgi:uncharacterized protein (TIGR03086 family)